jgi:serine/threonine protein kinase
MVGKYLFSSLEPYKLTRVELTGVKIGHGSYASIVEVNYMGLKCAGKTIYEVLLEQGEANYVYTVHHFKEECRILSTLRHPNIVQFLGVHFSENKGVPMLVMEFLPMNLTSCIEKHGILPEEISYSILYDVALGLYYLHSQPSPIIHRDLSANNVLLTYNMDAKISDLGVARILNLTPLQARQLTQTPGTPAYIIIYATRSDGGKS